LKTLNLIDTIFSDTPLNSDLVWSNSQASRTALRRWKQPFARSSHTIITIQFIQRIIQSFVQNQRQSPNNGTGFAHFAHAYTTTIYSHTHTITHTIAANHWRIKLWTFWGEHTPYVQMSLFPPVMLGFEVLGFKKFFI
jgi:hypothetical protein